MYEFDAPVFGSVYYPPIMLNPISIDNFEFLPDEIKQSIEDHKDEFKTEDDLRNFIRVQRYKS